MQVWWTFGDGEVAYETKSLTVIDTLHSGQGTGDGRMGCFQRSANNLGDMSERRSYLHA